MRKTAGMTGATCLALIATSIGLAAPSSATATGIVGASLTWKVHECAFSGAFVTTENPNSDSCFSIREDQTVSGNVESTDDGWRFGEGTGTYDPTTGETDIEFTGTLRLGNTSRGNYYIEIANPSVEVDESGNGQLLANVWVKSPGPSPATDRGRVEIVELPTVPDARDWTVTPPWANVGTPDATAPLDGKQFASGFVDAIDASMRNWFRASSSAEATDTRGEYNSLKQPAAVSVDLPETTWTPQLEITGADGMTATDTRTLTVRGTGFDPAVQGNGVAGLYVVFGPNPNAVTNGYTDPNIFGAAQYLPTGPNSQGEFETSLTVSGTYTDGNGKAWNPSSSTLGVSTWAAHTRASEAWDSFSPLAFSKPEVAASKPQRVRAARVVRVQGARAVVKWRAPRGAARDSVTGFLVRVSKRNSAKKFRAWKRVRVTSAVVRGVAQRGRYRIQVRAVNRAGVSPAVNLRLVKR